MQLDELFGLLFFLYVLGSILSALVRRGGARPGPPGGGRDDESGDVLDDVLDMEELERRLQQAREEMVQLPQPQAGEGPRPVAPPIAAPWEPRAEPFERPRPAAPPAPPAPSPPPARPAARSTAESTVRPSSLRPSTMASSLAPEREEEPVEPWWEGLPDDGLEREPESRERPAAVPMAPRGKEPGVRGRPAGAHRLPAAVAALIEGDRPWLAAMVLKEIWDEPRALRPHRVRPRV